MCPWEEVWKGLFGSEPERWSGGIPLIVRVERRRRGRSEAESAMRKEAQARAVSTFLNSGERRGESDSEGRWRSAADVPSCCGNEEPS